MEADFISFDDIYKKFKKEIAFDHKNIISDGKCKKVLLIDIGGTNIRTATAYIGSNEINNASKQNLDCLDSFDEIIQNLLSKDQNIKHIVFSVAGPKVNQQLSKAILLGQFNNHRWVNPGRMSMMRSMTQIVVSRSTCGKSSQLS